jgi:putative transcriptional regulator
MTYELYRGKVLVASPALDTDDHFKQSVVFVYEEKNETVYGLVLNQPSSLKIADVLKIQKNPIDPHPATISIENKLYKGGPVAEETVVLLHSNEWQSQTTHQIPHNLAISSDRVMLEKVATGNLPKDYKMLAGVSTWHPRQLAMEIHHGSWLTIKNPPPHLFFSKDGKAGWMDCVKLASSEAVDAFF